MSFLPAGRQVFKEGQVHSGLLRKTDPSRNIRIHPELPDRRSSGKSILLKKIFYRLVRAIKKSIAEFADFKV
jgi:hypothetical protein